MTEPGGQDVGPSPPDGAVDELLAGLRDDFARHRPQGSPPWNFSAAFHQLDETWGRPADAGPLTADARAADAPAAPTGADGAPAAPPGPARRLADRLVLDRLRAWVDFRAAAVASDVATTTTASSLGTVGTGFDATLEALRFLGARVEELERTASDRRAPVAGMPWLDVPRAAVPGHDALVVSVVAALVATGVDGPVWHAECGPGALLSALTDAGVAARGVDPRGAVVLDDARHGHLVEMGEAVDALSARGPGTLAGLVLSGVVDRVPIEDLCRLLRVATRCLRPGAPLVVLSDGPAAVNGWAAVARDLWPGRPLHPDTWAVLLTRLGYRDVHRLTGAPEGSGGPTGSAYAVFGRTPA